MQFESLFLAFLSSVPYLHISPCSSWVATVSDAIAVVRITIHLPAVWTDFYRAACNADAV